MMPPETQPQILIVDDDADIRECLQEVLQSEGYCTAVAKDGKEALKLLEGGTMPKLILLDLMMPVMNAAEFVEEYRRSEPKTDIPLVIMSASNAIEKQALKFSVAGFVKKPFEFRELLDTVKRFCIL